MRKNASVFCYMRKFILRLIGKSAILSKTKRGLDHDRCRNFGRYGHNGPVEFITALSVKMTEKLVGKATEKIAQKWNEAKIDWGTAFWERPARRRLLVGERRACLSFYPSFFPGVFRSMLYEDIA